MITGGRWWMDILRMNLDGQMTVGSNLTERLIISICQRHPKTRYVEVEKRVLELRIACAEGFWTAARSRKLKCR